MPTTTPTLDVAFSTCVGKLLQVHALTVAGKGASPEAEALRDEMDPLWHALTEDERQRIGALSEDLSVIAGGGITLVPMSGEERDAYARQLEAAYRAGAWDRVLALLRRPPSDLAPDQVAFLQAQTWERLAGPETALVFMREAERLKAGAHSAWVANLLGQLDRAGEERERVSHIVAYPGGAGRRSAG